MCQFRKEFKSMVERRPKRYRPRPRLLTPRQSRGVRSRGRGLLARVLPDSPRSSAPSTVLLVVILPPSEGQSPSPSGEAALRAILRVVALGLRVFGRFCQNGRKRPKTRSPFRCLPKGSVFRAVFFGLVFFKYF